MSDESESFIREVSEEVRRDRAQGVWKRFGPYVIGGLVALVLAVGVDALLTAQRVAAAREAGAALIAAGERADPAARAEALASAGAAMDPGPALLARLAEAAALAGSGDAAAAAALYGQTGPGDAAALGELAALRAGLLRIETEGPEAAGVALAPLTDPGRPFRLLALEALGVAKLASGDRVGAVEAFETALSDPAVTETLAARLTQLKAAAE